MIRLSWILLLFMVPASLTAILAGVSNAHQHFVMPALSPIILNIGLIIGFFSLDIGDDPMRNAKTLAWFFIFSALFQFLIQYIYVWRKGFAPKPFYRDKKFYDPQNLLYDYPSYFEHSYLPY